MKRFFIKTLGCKANVYDSQQLTSELMRRGWTPVLKAEAAQVCIINSCTVTDEADRQTRKLASKLYRENPDARIVVTGCAAEVDPERLAHSEGIHYVVGNRDKPRLVDLLLEQLAQAQKPSGVLLGATSSYKEMASRHALDREWPASEIVFQEEALLPPSAGGARKTRGFLKIQEGCNSFCTYCVIPYGRGPSRSLEPEQVIERVNALVETGVREIILTGTNLGDYLEGPSDFVSLLKKILKETSIDRLRLSSLDPTEILPELRELMASESRLCPHFHVSLQSASEKILKLMKRRYGMDAVRESLARIAELNTGAPVFVGMDVIAGFPGETDEWFNETYENLKALPWTRLHVFPYSERQGTPATRLPGSVSREVRVRRTELLNELSRARLKNWHETYRNQVLENVLFERVVKTPKFLAHLGTHTRWVGGYTPNYVRVMIPWNEIDAPSLIQNQVRSVSVSDLVVDHAAGEVVVIGKIL